VALIALRYDLRTPEFGAPHAALYDAALEQAAWADRIGFNAIVLSEHHGTPDGYLPSPLVMAAAVAGRTERIAITIAALLLPLHDPLHVAEDLAVLDHVSGGRVSVVLGLGYRAEEFEAFGVDYRRRGDICEEHARVLRQAWTGEPFEYRGTTVRALPVPRTPGGPLMFIGGSTARAARRAARLGEAFYPAIDDPALLAAYTQECEKLGKPPGMAMLPAGPNFVFVSENPDADWEWLGPHLLHDATTYHAWQAPGQRSIVESDATTVEQLRVEGKYLVLTPDECIELVNSLDEWATFVLHPLCGGLEPERAWPSLERFAEHVLPNVKRPALVG
jgi:alkanesulfonate monooxygenase SsuD/methylene tetrahydromethanopterin reductase-like flavin-dependent oxidoreductase (luciferase family)